MNALTQPRTRIDSTAFIVDKTQSCVATAGAKGHGLARLERAGFAVPSWFAISPAAFYASLTDRQTAALACTDGPRLALLDADHKSEFQQRFGILNPSRSVASAIQTIVSDLTADGGLLAVRSSAPDEDGDQHSFAGQLESFLNVPPDKVLESVVEVWQSAFRERNMAYRRMRGLVSPPQAPAVVIQRMVDAEQAGVAFSQDPTNQEAELTVVSAVRGLADALVAGETEGDTYFIRNSGSIFRHHGNGNDADPVLTDEQALEIAALAKRAEVQFGKPQDIEWAIKAGCIYLLQARPITTVAGAADRTLPSEQIAISPPDNNAGLPRPSSYARRSITPPVETPIVRLKSETSNTAAVSQADELNIWDNSNIGESYQGVTTPLTFSFARKAYENVYIEFCRMMGVTEHRIMEHAAIFPRMIGFVSGRIYYNLLSWYKLIAILPGFSINREFMEQMMGVKQSLPAELVDEISSQTKVGGAHEYLEIAFSLAKISHNLATIAGQIDRFNQRFEAALSLVPANLDQMTLGELANSYRGLERRLLKKWDAPLSNDFFAMIFYGLLRKLCATWCNDTDGTLQNNLICTDGGIVSAEPARLIQDLAEHARHDHALMQVLQTGSEVQAFEAIGNNAQFAELLNQYLDKFADRCLEELKLESKTLADEPLLLLRNIGRIAAVRNSGDASNMQRNINCGFALRREAEQRALQFLSGNLFRRAIFSFVLNQARSRIRDRENLRFQRTRLFGKVRRLFLAMGRQLVLAGQLDCTDDIFYLESEEVLGLIEGTATCSNLKAFVAARRADNARFRLCQAPADRFETRGAVVLAQRQENPATAHVAVGSDSEERRGLGCCPGTVIGQVRILHDPRLSEPLRSGEIVVAKRTDPGWILVFPQAAGLLVEHGSLLSHSAIVSRELGLPAIVSIPGITTWLKDGDWVEMDGATGIVRKVSI